MLCAPPPPPPSRTQSLGMPEAVPSSRHVRNAKVCGHVNTFHQSIVSQVVARSLEYTWVLDFSGGSGTVGIYLGGWAALAHHMAGALTGIGYRDEILQHHVIPRINVNGGVSA